MFDKSAALDVEGHCVAPLGAVVTRKVQIINDFSFDPKGAKGTNDDVRRWVEMPVW